MPRYSGTVGADFRCYATFSLEAKDEDEAFTMMEALVAECVKDPEKLFELPDFTSFEHPDWSNPQDVAFCEDPLLVELRAVSGASIDARIMLETAKQAVLVAQAIIELYGPKP